VPNCPQQTLSDFICIVYEVNKKYSVTHCIISNKSC
jgi:hypothetical protein